MWLIYLLPAQHLYAVFLNSGTNRERSFGATCERLRWGPVMLKVLAWLDLMHLLHWEPPCSLPGNCVRSLNLLLGINYLSLITIKSCSWSIRASSIRAEPHHGATYQPFNEYVLELNVIEGFMLIHKSIIPDRVFDFWRRSNYFSQFFPFERI